MMLKAPPACRRAGRWKLLLRHSFSGLLFGLHAPCAARRQFLRCRRYGGLQCWLGTQARRRFAYARSSRRLSGGFMAPSWSLHFGLMRPAPLIHLSAASRRMPIGGGELGGSKPGRRTDHATGHTLRQPAGTKCDRIRSQSPFPCPPANIMSGACSSNVPQPCSRLRNAGQRIRCGGPATAPISIVRARPLDEGRAAIPAAARYCEAASGNGRP